MTAPATPTVPASAAALRALVARVPDRAPKPAKRRHVYTGGERTDLLVGGLARAGWGELAGREFQGVRSVLRALIDLLPYGSGQGLATASQIADTAGLSERWTRTRLHLLEDAGVIRWQRGDVVAGGARPSAFRIDKRLLAALIAGARPLLDAVRAARTKRTAARLAGLPAFVKSQTRRERFRRSGHAALSDSPTPHGEVTDGASAPSTRSLRLWELPECEHGTPGGSTATCASCRRAAVTS